MSILSFLLRQLYPLVFLFLSPIFVHAQLLHVNPLIGTNGMGHTFPGACVPFGAIQLSPDTDTIPHNIHGQYVPNCYAYCAGYQYGDSTIVGFSHTHLSGTGHSDLGDILLMPTTGVLQLNPGRSSHSLEGYRSTFSHSTEVARPGFYSVLLSDDSIHVSLTSTPRVGIHKYIFPQSAPLKRVILDLSHGIYNYAGKTLWSSIRVESPTTLVGYRITNGWSRANYTYFAIHFSKPILNYGHVDKSPSSYSGFWHRFDINHNFPEMAGKALTAYFEFDNTADSVLEVKVALSGVSTAGALANLHSEAADKNFDQLASLASARWDAELSSVIVKGTPDQESMFYTSLYHTLINPSVYADVSGQYRGIDGNIHLASSFTNYTIFSLWDTYRAQHPLLNLLKPAQNADMLHSMLAHQQQSVHKMLPVWSHMGNENWCMSGYHAVSVLADALTKGTSLPIQSVLDAMVSTSTVPYYEGVKDYMELGYVPSDVSFTSASTTLEYAYDDWCIYHTALLNHDERLAHRYYKRALSYRNLFDTKRGFVRPKNKQGQFKPEFDPLQTHGEGFIEGNSWNFTFHAPHDVNGLIYLMGGDKPFISRLDSLFKMELPAIYFEKNEDITNECLLGGYVHGNEPSHHIPYLYAWTSQPWKTQYWVREIMNKMYKNHISGLSGNDDCGQMSAWYIFTSFGFYPVCPGTDQYVLGAPYMPEQAIHLSNGKVFKILANGVSDENRYVQAVYLNGKKLTRLYITHKEILDGGILEFIMGTHPNKQRGKSREDKPYSLTDGPLGCK